LAAPHTHHPLPCHRRSSNQLIHPLGSLSVSMRAIHTQWLEKMPFDSRECCVCLRRPRLKASLSATHHNRLLSALRPTDVSLGNFGQIIGATLHTASCFVAERLPPPLCLHLTLVVSSYHHLQRGKYDLRNNIKLIQSHSSMIASTSSLGLELDFGVSLRTWSIQSGLQRQERRAFTSLTTKELRHCFGPPNALPRRPMRPSYASFMLTKGSIRTFASLCILSMTPSTALLGDNLRHLANDVTCKVGHESLILAAAQWETIISRHLRHGNDV
jgi:hypothetical protein